ncbi:hypothetical protein [Aliikangiella coralliicola]|uniref:DUF2846 domain-containing protein n=1 Tax=Aliikangiella coralliicola TaxID=2592383 RepID=A0A545UEE6_9GAMM|nr:hypothetical protein [Aliikangiella coralliicola]TQV87849.1 hypothetical protein FLL46_10750 [Aliikangiella coralliicola]
MSIFRVLILSMAMIMVGCASNPMQIKTNQTIQKANQNESQVIFMRSSFVGSAINGSLYDIIDGQPKFIGIIANGTKIAYNAKPGKHLFMVVSEAADFLEADLTEGKTYYSLITPRMGFWKARFSMWPIKNDENAEYSLNSSDFKEWLLDTKLVENSAKSNQWFEKNKNSVHSKYLEYLPVWKEKTPQDRAKRTLHPQDGN